MSEAAAAKPWTIARLLGWTREHLEKHGVESPRLCAELLLADALKCERLRLFTRYEESPAEPVLARFREHVREAAGGKPIAYILGRREFFSLSFEVSPDVLVPRPETETLVERTISLLRERSAPRVLDVGTGSGCIAIALAKHLPSAQLFASDVSEAALAVARRNASASGVADRIEFRSGDLLAPWSDAPAYDVIVSNPPYIGTREAGDLPRNVRDFEPHLALFAGEDGLSIIRRLSREAGALLAEDGHLLMEVAFDQSAAVRDLMESAGWGDILCYRDALQHERVVHGRRRSSAAIAV